MVKTGIWALAPFLSGPMEKRRREGKEDKRVKKKCNNLMLSSGQAEGAVHISPPIFCLHSELAFPSSSFPQKAAGTSGIFHFS